MSLSKKIAAALDENTKAYVLPCTVTVEDSPNRLTLNLTALDTVGLAFSTMEFANTSRTEWSSKPSRSGAIGCQAGDLPDGAAESRRGRRPRGRGPDAQPEPHASRTGAGLLRNATLPPGKLAHGTIVFDEATRQRRQVPCQLTRETLERLADDIAASVG